MTINHGSLAGQRQQVNAVALVAGAQLKPVMRQAFAVQPLGHAAGFQQRHRAGFQHAGAHTAQHMVATALFDDEVVNPGRAEQLAQQQPGRATTNDGNLGSHAAVSCLLSAASVSICGRGFNARSAHRLALLKHHEIAR